MSDELRNESNLSPAFVESIRQARLNSMPDPCGKQQLAFVRAMRRGSAKRSTPDKEVKLVRAAQSTIPPAVRVK